MPTTALYNNTILVDDGRFAFIPSGSATTGSIIARPLSNAIFEVTCSANTSGNLAPTASTGSFISFANGKGQRLIVLFTTSSNSELTKSIFVPKSINKPRLKYVTASVNFGDNAATVAASAYNALSKSLAAEHDKISSLIPGQPVTGSFTASLSSDKILVQSLRPGCARLDFNSQLTSSYGFVINTRSTGSGYTLTTHDAPGRPDVKQATFKIGMPSPGSKDLVITSSAGPVLFVSESGRLGIGTIDPKTQFDIRTAENTTDGTKLLLRSSRGIDNPLQVGDLAGELDFVVESGSFDNIETSGSIGKIKGVITSVNATGATGKIVVAVAKGTVTDSQDIVEWRYASDATLGSNFAQIMSASLLIKDHSTTLLSKLQIRKHDHTLYMSAESGSLYVKETGSFGLIEGGTF